MAQRPAAASLAELQLAPTDLLGGSRIDPRTERAGDQLRAETDAEGRARRGEAAFEERDLPAEKRVNGFFIGADRTAEHDDQVGRQRIDPVDIVDAGVAIADGIPIATQHAVERAEVLEMDMPDRDRSLAHRWELTPPSAISNQRLSQRPR